MHQLLSHRDVNEEAPVAVPGALWVMLAAASKQEEKSGIMNACFLFTSCMNTCSYRGVENWELQLQPNTLTFDLFTAWNL